MKINFDILFIIITIIAGIFFIRNRKELFKNFIITINFLAVTIMLFIYILARIFIIK